MEAIKRFQLAGIPFSNGVAALLVGMLLLGWLFNTPSGLLGKADAVGYAVCHRIDLRSFHIGERALPLCVRCTGMYLGAVLGLIYQGVKSVRRSGMPGRGVMVLFGFFLLAFAFDGSNSYLSLFPGAPVLYEPRHWLRLATGTGMGLAIAGVLLPVFNQTVWRERDSIPYFPGFKSLLPLISIAVLINLLVLTENPLILYPLALVGAGGVVFILTLVYAMLWVLILKQENRFLRASQLTWPLIAGFGTGLLQIVVIDGMRFLLTGTWDGFHLG